MVMHARKPQRMNDGYFEKHQAHPYQNSKYSSSKGSYGSSGDRYERIRDSPNGNSYRSDSPDSQSPRDRDRAYQSKGSYLQKIREKERENRDYKMSRDKYSDCARSPKDKRSRESRDSEHRTNHDRSSDEKLLVKMTSQNSSRDRKPLHNCTEKLRERDERERLTRVGDWSEHISSSGKKYYYNCKTEVSQWEKPREWMERELRDRERFSSSRGSSGGSGKERSSGGGGSSGDRDYSSRSASSSHDKHSNARGSKRHWRDEQDSGHHDPRRKHVSQDGDIQSTQDMDISPGDSTPTSEVSYVHTPSTSGPSSAPSATATSEDVHTINLATALPRLQQTPNMATTSVSASPSLEHPPSMVPPPAGGAPSCNTPGPPLQSASVTALPRLMAQPKSLDADANGERDPSKALQMLGQRSASVDGDHITDGPPTPTHSETPDCLDPRKQLLSQVSSAAAVTSPPVGTAGPSTPLSGLQQHVNACTSSLSALRPQGPCITPSLANYYRDDLVNHVRGWPADILEKQAQKLSEEAHVMGSLQCTKVSAELKSARSIVRLTEIQATLQEQRILFLRQQIKTLEDMKAQNSFMSDDS